METIRIRDSKYTIENEGSSYSFSYIDSADLVMKLKSLGRQDLAEHLFSKEFIDSIETEERVWNT